MNAQAETVTILTRAQHGGPRNGYDRMVIAGRTIARRDHRDKAVWLAKGVTIAERRGGFGERAGSLKSPSLYGIQRDDDTLPILRVQDVPADWAAAHGYTAR